MITQFVSHNLIDDGANAIKNTKFSQLIIAILIAVFGLTLSALGFILLQFDYIIMPIICLIATLSSISYLFTNVFYLIDKRIATNSILVNTEECFLNIMTDNFSIVQKGEGIDTNLVLGYNNIKQIVLSNGKIGVFLNNRDNYIFCIDNIIDGDIASLVEFLPTVLDKKRFVNRI